MIDRDAFVADLKVLMAKYPDAAVAGMVTEGDKEVGVFMIAEMHISFGAMFDGLEALHGLVFSRAEEHDPEAVNRYLTSLAKKTALDMMPGDRMHSA